MLPEKSAELSFQKKFLEAIFRRKIVFREQMNSLLDIPGSNLISCLTDIPKMHTKTFLDDFQNIKELYLLKVHSENHGWLFVLSLCV